MFLEDPDFVDTWLKWFAACARTKKQKDNREKGGENEITDFFLTTAGCKAIMKVSTIAYPTNLKNLTLEKISQIIRRNTKSKKRLVMAERIKFISMKQEIDEPIIKYLHRLRNASRYCEFEELGQEEQTIKEDLIQLRLIEGMYIALCRYKIMEQLQIGNMSLNTFIDFIQQQELIQKYNCDKSQPRDVEKKISKNVRIVDVNMKWKRKYVQHLGKTCTNCLKKELFSSSMKIQKEKLWKSWRKRNQYGSLLSKTKTRTWKNWTKENIYYT